MTVKVLLSLVLVAAAAAVLSANSANGDEAASWQSRDVALNAKYSVEKVLTGDVDGDGDLDIIVFGDVNVLYWVKNTGGGVFEQSVTTVDASVPHGVNDMALGDLNSDGDLDIAIVGDSGDIVWYKNVNGVGTQWQKQTFQAAGSPSALHAIAIADINGDGQDDIMAGSAAAGETNPLQWYRQDGLLFETFASMKSYEVSGVWDIVLVNSTASSGMDALVAMDGLVYLLINGDGGVFAQNYSVNAASHSGHVKFGLGDFNDDGLVGFAMADFVTKTITWSPGGSGNLFDIATVSAVSDLAVADMDDDGSPDVVVATDDDVLIFVNPYKNGTFVGPLSVNGPYESLPTLSTMAMADLSGGGRIDGVFGQSGWTPGALVLKLQANETTLWDRQFLNSDWIAKTRAVDADGDGDTDIYVLGRESNTIHFIENLGSDVPNWAGGVLIHSSAIDFDTGDRNNNGLPDLVILTTSNEIQVWNNTHGTGKNLDVLPLTGTYNGDVTNVALQDIDGDHFDDVVYIDDGKIGVYTNQQDGDFGENFPLQNGALTGGDLMIFADVNNDTEIDIVAGSSNPQSVGWFRNEGGGSFATYVELATNTAPSSLFVADVDADGYVDLLIASEANEDLAYLKGNASGLTSQSVLLMLDTHKFSSAVAFDSDLDGHIDLVYTTRDLGKVYLRHGVGNGAFAPEEYVVAGLFDTYSLTMADVNGDQRNDLLVSLGGQQRLVSVTYTKCVAPLGKSCTPNSAAVIACAPGTFANETNQRQCFECPLGQAQPLSQQTECIPCSPGYFANTTGSDQCRQCAAGSSTSAQGSVECPPCDPGTEQLSSGHTGCAPCDKGNFKSNAGAGACQQCPAGKFASLLGTVECESCAPGDFSAAGAQACQPCAGGRFTIESGKSTFLEVRTCSEHKCHFGGAPATNSCPICDDKTLLEPSHTTCVSVVQDYTEAIYSQLAVVQNALSTIRGGDGGSKK